MTSTTSTQLQFQRLSASTIKAYKSFVNGFKAAANSQNIDVEVPTEELCQWICGYLDLLGQTRNSQYVTSMRASIADYYRPKYGNFVEYNMSSQYLKGNPGLHFAILEKLKAITTTKVRDHGETQKKSYPLDYNDIVNIQKELVNTMHPFCFLQIQLLIRMVYYGCMRIQSVLDLKWNDVKVGYDNELNKKYLEVLINWNKTKDIDIFYRFYDLEHEESLHCVDAYEKYTSHSMFKRMAAVVTSKKEYIFCGINVSNGEVQYDLLVNINQAAFLKLLKVHFY